MGLESHTFAYGSTNFHFMSTLTCEFINHCLVSQYETSGKDYGLYGHYYAILAPLGVLMCVNIAYSLKKS